MAIQYRLVITIVIILLTTHSTIQQPTAQNQQQQSQQQQLQNEQQQNEQQQSQLQQTQQQQNQHQQSSGQVSQQTNNLNDQRRQDSADDVYQVGFGIADITGPAADINLVSLLQQLGMTATSLGLTASRKQNVGDSDFSSSSTSSLLSLSEQSSLSSQSARNSLVRIQHPRLSELEDIKFQFKINLKLLSQSLAQTSLLRWAMPSRVKMQAEFTFANLVVQL